jgi:predicted glycoside hydrolase/deacetylase ChbG (UPF0249 family)
VKRLIVTADDVGLHAGMTAGALLAHDRGIVSAVSVAAAGAAFAEAVPMLLDRTRLDVGIHLVLTGERPLSPPAEVRSLLGSNGELLPGFRAFAWRYFHGGVREYEVEVEWRRQLERLLDSGLRPVHLNSHQHLHVLPRLFPIACRLAEEAGIPFVRLPEDTAAVVHGFGTRNVEISVLNWLSRRARRGLPVEAPSRRVHKTVGVLVAGKLTVDAIAEMLALVGSASELVCHPGLDDGVVASRYAWRYRWEEETAALCDPRVPAMLRAAGVELGRFSGLTTRVG